MRRTNVLNTCLIFTAACFVAAAQNQNLESGTMTYGPGIWVGYVTVAEPALKHPREVEFSGGFRFDGNLLHRIVLSKVNKTYFGYDVVVDAIEGTTQCRVSIEPLSLSPAEMVKETSKWRTSVDSSWKAGLLPRYPAPQVVDAGDTIALDLLVSQDGRQKVVDYIQASCKKTGEAALAENETPRDFNAG